MGITSNVTNINEKLLNLEYLKEFDVDKNNDYYLSEDGVIYNKDKTKLIKYPQQKEGESYIIPDNTKEIGEDAFTRCKLKTVIIGKTVELLERDAFSYCENLEEIKIPDNLKNKNSDVFWGSKNIKKIIVPSSVININSVFYVTSLKEIDVDKDNNNYCSENGILYNKDKSKLIYYPASKEEEVYKISDSTKDIEENAFAHSNLKHIILGKSVVSINEDAFYDCEKIQEITLSDNLENIHERAFRRSGNIKKLNIPATVTNINSMFYELYSLEEINVDKDNKNYLSEDGILYNADKSKLIRYLKSKSEEKYTIPNSVKEIGEGAFEDCTNLKEITINNNVTNINKNAFTNISDNLVIYGEFDSIAYTYSLRNNIKFDIIPEKAWYFPGISNEDIGAFNFSYNSAKYLESGVSVRGNEDRYYRFTGKEGDFVEIEIDFKREGYYDIGDMKLCLRDRDGNDLSSGVYVKAGECKTLSYMLKKSDFYYVVLTGARGKYSIKVSGIDDNIDTDGDGLYDSQEYYHFTNILLKDTDGDCVDDCTEIKLGRNPLEIEDVKELVVNDFIADKKSPQKVGTMVNLSVEATGNGKLQYKFIISDNKGNWYRIRDFEEDNTCLWNATAIGSKTLYVDVKDEIGQIVRKSLNYIVEDFPIKVSSFTVDKQSPQPSGSTIKLNVEAEGNGILNYKFILKNNENGNWYLLRNFGTSNTAIWKTGLAGNKTLYVDVKDEDGKVVRKAMNYTVK